MTSRRGNGVLARARRLALQFARCYRIISHHLERTCRAGKLPPIHPGEILQEEFLGPLGISQYRVAKETSVSPRRINEIVRGTRVIIGDTAWRLSRYFGTSERFWLNLQVRYDLELEAAPSTKWACCLEASMSKVRLPIIFWPLGLC